MSKKNHEKEYAEMVFNAIADVRSIMTDALVQGPVTAQVKQETIAKFSISANMFKRKVIDKMYNDHLDENVPDRVMAAFRSDYVDLNINFNKATVNCQGLQKISDEDFESAKAALENVGRKPGAKKGYEEFIAVALKAEE